MIQLKSGTSEITPKEKKQRAMDPWRAQWQTAGGDKTVECGRVSFGKTLSVQSLQLWEISPTSSILILCPAAIRGDSPFCPGCFAFGSMFDPLRPLSRDLPLSMCCPSIGPTPSTCAFANLMFKIGRLSLRSRCEI